jgi:phytoene dehydrogenase-like protein
VIVVIGGGLAGLRAALTVQESGQQVHLVEASESVGGRLTTEKIDGFTIDKGFQVINPGYREFDKLDIRTNFHVIPAGAVAYVGGQWRFFGDPRREARSLLGALSAIASEPLPFLSILRGVFLAKIESGESAANFLQRIGITGEVYEAIVEPFLRGVFLAALTEVDARFARRVLRSLYRHVPGLPDGGVQTIAQELRNRLKSIQCGTRVLGITRTGKGFTVRTENSSITARKVIVATDYHGAETFAGNSGVDLPKIDSAHSHAWYFTIESPLRAQHQLHVAPLQSGPVVTAVDIAAVVPSYSPDGRGLLSVTTLESCSEAQVRNHLQQIYGEPITGELITEFAIANALPIIAPGAKRTGILDHDGLVFAGDYLTEPSQNGALLSGRLAGEAVINN